MNETNRGVIILLAGIWIVLMAVVIFVAWAADREAVDRLGDFVQYLDDHRDSPSRLILPLGALVLVVLALLVIIVEVAPEEQTRELKVEQAGATTIVPAEALRLRLEEALVTLPQVTAAKARVYSRDKGIGASLDLTVTPDTNVAAVTQEATRVVVDALQTDLGLPVAGVPSVRIVFAQTGERPLGAAKPEPVASSMVQPPLPGAGAPAEPSAPAEAAAAGGPPSVEQPPAQEETPGEHP